MSQLENANIEFKREYSTDIRKEVVAFANSNGGTIYIGVDDSGASVDLGDDIDQILLQAVNMVHNAIKPDVSMFAKCATAIRDEKNIIIIEVMRGTNRPYYIADKGLKPSGVYVRSGSASIPASSDAIRAMIKETDGDRFERGRSLNQELTFNASREEFEKRNLALTDTQLRTLGMINEDGLYTNLALLLSEQCQHTTKVAIFQGNTKSVFKDRREFGGSLLKQLVSVYDYIDNFNKTYATVEGLLRIDKRDYPEVAIREALLNAMVHREYSFSGSTLISIFDNRIEMVTLGGLIPGLSLEAIKIGASQSRNEHLASIFYRLRLIEAYGTGIGKIIESYSGQLVQPEFIATDGAFSVVLPNLNEHNTKGQSDELPANAQKVLTHMRDHGDVSRKDVEKLLDIKQTASGNLLRELEKANMIEQFGNSKNIMYRLKN